VLGPLLDAVEALPDKHEVPAEVIARLGYLGQLPPNTPDLERHEKLQRFREYWVARYEAGVKQFDGHFAEVRNDLKTLGLWDSSCVVVLSDHGEQLAEKGAWNHGDSVWETELHVPLMLRWPGQVPAGRRVTQLVSLVDLGPTLLDLLDLPAAERVQGRSLLPLLEEGAATQSPRAIMAEGVKRPPEQKALLLGRWKLIQYFDTGRQALYDLAADPGEQHDLAGTHAEKVKAYQELLDAQLIDNGKLAEGGAVQQVDLTPAQIKRLRDLGYLGE
jgi:arylsulfatase A-like enzyme